ncbi:MAG TPA: Calx-beta domain-containing protein [Steroidobacteraceae bacterium]
MAETFFASISKRIHAKSFSILGAGAALSALFLPLVPIAAAQGASVFVGLAIAPSTVARGAPVTVTWNAQNATSCTASGAWTGARYINGQLQITPTVTGVDTYTITCSGAAGSASASKSVTVTGTTAPPTAGNLDFSAAAYSINQSTGTATIRVNRNNGSAGSASVSYKTNSGSAIAGAQFTSTSGTLQWSAGDAQPKSFSVPIAASPFSGDRSFTVALAAASGATLGSPAAATVTIAGDAVAASGNSSAAILAVKLGRPARLLVGLGGQGNAEPISAIISQRLSPDIFDEYLVGAGAGDWTTWNSPAGAYVGVVAAKAASVGAIPMFTLYQMAANGDGNLAELSNAAFMTRYWANVRLMYQEIGILGKPALVNLEPDFWGYAEQHAANGNPSTVFAYVSSNADCGNLSNDVKGVAGCMVQMARKYAPKAYVGFPPSTWGGTSTAAVVAFMSAVGAQNADFIVQETLDRDAGCFEVQEAAAGCVRAGSPWYWDASNQTHPNFEDHLAMTQAFHAGLNGLPVIWWQTPLGVPSTVKGGTDFRFRDNREQYFLTHPSELTAVGGLAVVFGAGENHQTNITTDGGQFQALSTAYFSAPAKLP